MFTQPAFPDIGARAGFRLARAGRPSRQCGVVFTPTGSNPATLPSSRRFPRADQATAQALSLPISYAVQFEAPWQVVGRYTAMSLGVEIVAPKEVLV
jgi:hypothetical protein